MKLFQTEQEKKSLVITVTSFTLLFLLFFLLKFSDSLPLPEMEGGGGGGEIAVNFGDSELGSGENFDSKEVVTAEPDKAEDSPTEEKEIIVSENEEAPAVVEVKKPDTKIEKKAEEKPVVKPTPKPSKSTSDAVSNLLNGSNKEGDGNDKTAGNKGKSNGDTNSKGHNGGGGSGTGSGGGNGSGEGLGSGSGYGTGSGSGKGSGNGNYQLGNRKALNTPKPKYTCSEEGVVVVQISVDKSGTVTNANPGVRGTTNSAKCLLEQAKIAAMNTKWQADATAAETQIGKIIYNFKLTQ
jgi:outer membrane biosynthesis protein TonB